MLRLQQPQGGQDPAEAGMPLARQPAPVGIHAKHRLTLWSAASAWDKYLFC
jgi:hypothetical protein